MCIIFCIHNKTRKLIKKSSMNNLLSVYRQRMFCGHFCQVLNYYSTENIQDSLTRELKHQWSILMCLIDTMIVCSVNVFVPWLILDIFFSFTKLWARRQDFFCLQLYKVNACIPRRDHNIYNQPPYKMQAITRRLWVCRPGRQKFMVPVKS